MKLWINVIKMQQAYFICKYTCINTSSFLCPTIFLMGAILSFKHASTMAWPNILETIKEQVAPVAVRTHTSGSPTQGPNIAPAKMFWKEKTKLNKQIIISMK